MFQKYILKLLWKVILDKRSQQQRKIKLIFQGYKIKRGPI